MGSIRVAMAAIAGGLLAIAVAFGAVAVEPRVMPPPARTAGVMTPPPSFGQSVAAAPEHVAQAVQSFFVPDPRTLFGKNDVRVLVVGLDYDYDSKDQETSKNSRSDIIMAVNLDLRRHRISELSIPRDMIATMPDGRRAKINQAQSEGGIAESQRVIASWLGIPGFDRYVVLRIDTAKDLINALGGIDLTVKDSNALRGQGPNGPIDYDDHWGHLSIHLKPGFQHLNGENAVAYARFRHDWCSDPCRIERQQQVLHAIVARIENDRFNTLTHVQQLLAVVRNDIQTNITPREQLSTAVAFAQLKPSDIATAQVPYTATEQLPDYGDSLVPDEQARAQEVATMFGTAAAPQASPAATVANAGDPPIPADIRIRVENGTHVPGLAAKIAAQLRAHGFTIVEIADAHSHDVTTTEIHGHDRNAPAVAAIQHALGKQLPAGASVVSAPATTAPGNVTVVLGHDITAVVPETQP